MELKIQIKDYDKLYATFKKAPALAAQEYGDSMERIAVHIQSEAKNAAPVNKGIYGNGKLGRGGTLRQSIKYRRLGSAGAMVWVDAEYGVYVDQGTRPHVILPKRAKYLAFQTATGWVRARRVNHPGTKAQPFFTNAVLEGQTYADAEMSKAMDRVLSKI